MTTITLTIKLFTSQGHDSITINNLILEYKGNNYQFHGGTRDTIHVFIQSIALYVLSINRSLGHMALNAFMVPHPDAINGVYMHTPQEIIDHLGQEWDQLPPLAIVEKLMDYLF